MAAHLLRLLAIVSLMLMPFGMSHADAMSADVSSTQASSHCADMGEQDSHDQDRSSSGMIDCKGMCSAVPVRGESLTQTFVMKTPLLVGVMIPFAGLEPETATPPPRMA